MTYSTAKPMTHKQAAAEWKKINDALATIKIAAQHIADDAQIHSAASWTIRSEAEKLFELVNDDAIEALDNFVFGVVETYARV